MDTTAREIMSSSLITVHEGITVEDALKILINERITGVPVLDKQSKLIGMLSEYDIMAQISAKKGFKSAYFKEEAQFSRKVQSIAGDMPMRELLPLFVDSKFRRLPVTDEAGRLIGIITRRDLMKLFYYRAKLG